MVTNVSLILPSGFFSSLRDYLLDGSDNEYCCYLTAGVVQSGKKVRLVGRKRLFPDKKDDYSICAPYSCKPNLYFIDNTLFDAPRENDLIRKNLSLIDIHSHPFAKGRDVSFSSIDDSWQKEVVEYFFQVRKYSGFYCAIVLGEDSFDGRVWFRDKKNGDFHHVTLDSITILDYPYRKWEHPGKKNKSYLSKTQTRILDRQILAFGRDGQKLLSNAKAGIVGVGGIGSIAAEGLARLGVNQFVLVDRDTSDISNLNRFVGMSYSDAVISVPKCHISAREILSINPRAKVEIVNAEVYAHSAMDKLKMADFIVLGTDNVLSRAFVNEFCLQYCIPLFSVGVAINVQNPSGKLEDIFGSYLTVLPGTRTCCLNCSGAIDYHEVSYLLSSPAVRSEGERRGYVNVPGFRQPAVRPLNGVMTEMALSEIHNYFCGFKGQMVEGLSYDQKNNILYKNHFLNKKMESYMGDTFFEYVVSDGVMRIQINGDGFHEMHGSGDIDELCANYNLNDIQKTTLMKYFEDMKISLSRKESCPYCGENGIIGRGENEPLTDYIGEE